MYQRRSITGIHAVVVLSCGALLMACTQVPQSPAPVFALPLTKVIGAPAIEGQEPAPTTAQPSARQLRYVAVPPGRNVPGMARAHLILKQASTTPRHTFQARKTKAVARREGVRTAATKPQAEAGPTPPVEDAPAAMIMLDEPAADRAKSGSNP